MSSLRRRGLRRRVGPRRKHDIRRRERKRQRGGGGKRGRYRVRPGHLREALSLTVGQSPGNPGVHWIRALIRRWRRR
jgi:hypothetical protein